AQHPLGDVEIRDHPVLQRPNDVDVAGRAPEHRLGFMPYSDDGAVRVMDRADGGFIEDNPLSADEQECSRRAQVDRYVIREFLDPSLEQDDPRMRPSYTTILVDTLARPRQPPHGHKNRLSASAYFSPRIN